MKEHCRLLIFCFNVAAMVESEVILEVRVKNVFRKVRNNSFLFSCIIVLLSFFVCFIVNGFNINISNDDLLIEVQLYYGYYDTIFINWFLSAVLIPIQALFKGINILACSQLLVNIVAMFGFVYTILKKRNSDILSIVISIIILIIFSPFGFVHLQWTITATISATAGYILLFFMNSEQKKNMIIKTIVGCLLILYSSFLRISSFLSVSAVLGITVFCLSLIAYIRTYKKEPLSIKNGLNKIIKPVVFVGLIILVSYSLSIVSENIKLTTIPGYSDYKTFNSVRSSAADYGQPPYEENKDFYSSIGIESQNDLYVYQTWVHDNDFFTVEKLQKLADYSERSEVGYKFSIGLMFNILNNKISEYTSINPSIIVVLIGLVLLAVLVGLFIVRNKIKFIFPCLLSVLWIAYFYVFRLSTVNSLMVVVAILSIIISFLYNRYYFILSSIISILSIGLYTYLNFGRPIFRATFTFLFPTIIVLFVLISDTIYLRKTRLISSIKTKKLITIPMIVLSVMLSGVFGFVGWGSEVKPKDNKRIAEYIKNNSDKCFVSSIWQCYDMTTNALLFNDIPDNVIIYGWLDGSEFDRQRKEALNICSLYRDALNRDDVFFTTHVNSKELIENYYNEHYSNSIKLKQIIVFDEYGVYRIKKQ